MKRKATKVYYAVRRGRAPGLYYKWDDCFAQTRHFPRAEFQKFKTEQAARLWLEGEKKEKTPGSNETDRPNFLEVYTDGSYKPHDNGAMGYGAWFKDDKGVEHGFFQHADKHSLLDEFGAVVATAKKSSSLVEMCAAVHMLRLLRGKFNNVRIHADNDGVRNWYTGSWKAKAPGIKSLLEAFKKEVNYFDRVEVIAVDGHSGDYGNDCADDLANRGARNESKNANELFVYKD